MNWVDIHFTLILLSLKMSKDLSTENLKIQLNTSHTRTYWFFRNVIASFRSKNSISSLLSDILAMALCQLNFWLCFARRCTFYVISHQFLENDLNISFCKHLQVSSLLKYWPSYRLTKIVSDETVLTFYYRRQTLLKPKRTFLMQTWLKRGVKISEWIWNFLTSILIKYLLFESKQTIKIKLSLTT